MKILLAVHLLLICTGSRIFDFSWLPAVLQQPDIYYLSLTGGHPYSFFSPDIPPQYLVSAVITDSSGAMTQLEMNSSSNAAGLRIVAAIQLLCDNEDYKTLGEIVSRYYRQLYPGSRTIAVTISRYLPPACCAATRAPTALELYKKEYAYE
ncbi:MAG: hypothetical protein JST90_19235 [Bacteroidetes bacterium]|nr:hypothetical protein [Bacteroidota bacterium]